MIGFIALVRGVASVYKEQCDRLQIDECLCLSLLEVAARSAEHAPIATSADGIAADEFARKGVSRWLHDGWKVHDRLFRGFNTLYVDVMSAMQSLRILRGGCLFCH